MKKTESMTIRITEDLKRQLQEIADQRRWTLSQTASIILEENIDAYIKKVESMPK